MKKLLSLAVFALCAMSSMAQSAKADLLIQERKFNEALPVIKAEIAKVDESVSKAKAKAAEKGKPVDLSKFNAKYAALYNQAATCEYQTFYTELLNASKAEFDTVVFVKSLDNTIDNLTKCYVYDHTPNAKGKVAAKFEKDNVSYALGLIDYYFNAGYFLHQNGDKEGAGVYFQKHLDLPSNPILVAKKDSLLAAKKDNYEQCAYFNCILNYELENYDKVLKSVDAGLGNPQYAHDLYYMKAEAALKTTGDSAAYVNVIKEAVNNLEDNSRFCETLLAYYYERNDAAGAHSAVDEIIAKSPKSAIAHYMKGCVYMNIENKFADARDCFARALAIDPNDANTNGNMAFAYMNDGRIRRLNGEWPLLDKKTVTGATQVEKYNKQLAEFRDYYEKALPYMEKYRELQPEKSKTWAPALQQIYANLGRQAEADAMDDIMAANARDL